jgi:DMSO/TMAO reductase YedYZ molybdopterin-dependent catalytic subunit
MTSHPAPWISRLFSFGSKARTASTRPASERRIREGIRPPKFADKFALLDFEAPVAPVISMFAPPPQLTLGDVTIGIRGEDLKYADIPWSTLSGVPRVSMKAPMVCQIFNWNEEIEWSGIRLADFLVATGLQVHELGYFVIHSRDGQYFETLSRDEALDPRVMLVNEMNGLPLPHEYGGPVRLVVPFLQGYKSVKWVARIHAYRHDPIGIKRLLGQSKSGALGRAWLDKLGIVPAEGRAGDPAPDRP